MGIESVQNKNTNNTNLFHSSGNNQRIDKEEKSLKKSDNKSGKSIYAADLNLAENDILAKKLQAGKKALKTILDAFTKDGKLDDNLDSRRERIGELKKEASNAMAERDKILEAKEQLKKDLEITDESQEQKDLNILEKVQNRESLTKEEVDRVQQMGPLTEYQKTVLEYNEMVKVWQKRADNAVEISKMEQYTIDKVNIERLKSDPMLDAKKQAEEILEKSSKEVISMLQDEAKEKVDEETEENQEKIEENKKQKAQEDAEKLKKEIEDKMQKLLIEKLRAKSGDEREEYDRKADSAAESIALSSDTMMLTNSLDMNQIQKADSNQKKLQSEIKNIMMEQKLMEDDLKGVEVDEVV